MNADEHLARQHGHREDAAEAPNRRLGLAALDGFRPDIQALRGLAVLLVVLYHAQVVVPGGFVGVDIFFVISGYVIGRRLIARLAGPRRGVMGEFYLHRARRILPALAMLLATVILLAPLLAPISSTRETSRTGIAAALFSANFYLYKVTGAGYFATSAELNPLLHTWSLSVEEQFYFAIPVLLLGAWLFGRRRWGPVGLVRALVGMLFVTSLALCVSLSGADGTVWRVNGLRFAFFSPFTRAWEFAAGLVLVLLPIRWVAGPRLRPVLLAVGLAMVLVAAFAFSDTTVFPGTAALLPVVGTALAIHAGTRAERSSAPVPTPPGLRPMTWIGDISYSWYLWHWPLIVFATAFWPGQGRWPLVLAASFSLLPAWWSYRGLERPLRATTRTRARPTVLLAACCIVAPLAAAVVAVPIRTYANHLATDRFQAVTALQSSSTSGVCTAPVSMAPDSRCTAGDPAGPSVVLIGDSNANALGAAFIGAAEATGADLRIAAVGGCPFVGVDFELPFDTTGTSSPSGCRRFTDTSMAAMEDDPPDVAIVVTRTDYWIHLDGFAFIDPATGDRVVRPADRAAIMEDALARQLGRLRAAGSRVVLVDVAPKPPTIDPRECSNLAFIVDASRCLPPPFRAGADEQVAAANRIQRRAARHAGVATWGFAEQICPHGDCQALRDGELVWADQTHISVPTSRALVPAATQLLRTTLAAAPGGSTAPR